MKKFNKIIVSACLIVTFMFHTMNVEAQDLIAGFGAAFDEYGIPAPELDPFLKLPFAVNAKHYYYKEIWVDRTASNDLSLEFDANGRFVKSEIDEVRYDDQGRKIWINTNAYFANRGEIYEIKYNELGLVDSYTVTWKKDNIVHDMVKYEYDESKHTCTKIVTSLHQDTVFHTSEYRTIYERVLEYDPAYGWERIIRNTFINCGDINRISDYTDYTYDERGNLIQEKKIDGKDGSYHEITINGKKCNVEYYSEDTKDYVYDEQNRMIQETRHTAHLTENDKGEILEKSESWEIFHYAYEYDEQGRLVQIIKATETPGYYYYVPNLGDPVALEPSIGQEVWTVVYTY